MMATYDFAGFLLAINNEPGLLPLAYRISEAHGSSMRIPGHMERVMMGEVLLVVLTSLFAFGGFRR